MSKQLAVLIVVILVALAAWQITRPPANAEYDVRIIAPDAELPNLGFQSVGEALVFDSPTDPHPEYQYERWQLDLSDCYEMPATITFDRIGLISERLAPERESAWAFQQVIIADVQLPEYQQTRYSRSALDLAGAENGRVWLEDWRLAWDEAAYTLNIGEQLTIDLLPQNPAQTEKTGTYYLIEQDLQTQINGEICTAALRHSFGEQIPFL